MRILFLSNWFPCPPDNGARMRTWGILRQLAGRHEVSLLSFVRDGEASPHDRDRVRALCSVLGTVPYREFVPWRPRALLRLLSPFPRALWDLYSPEMERRVQETLDDDSFDLVMASEIGPGLGVSFYLSRIAGIPRVIEDLELSMIWNQVQGQRAPVKGVRRRMTWWKQRGYAAYLLDRVDGCTVASDQERVLLQHIAPGAGPLAVIPNGLDLERYEGEWGEKMPDSLIFPGSLTYPANWDAMAFFLEEVFPLIRARRPGVVLSITGRTDGVPLDRLPLREGVVLTGYVEDLRPILARSQVCVVPLRAGGGTRLKILEAMALGTPVVSTSLGAEGLEATAEQEILIADEPAQFADAVLRLLDDAALRTRLAARARALVRARYGWDRIGRLLDPFLQQVAEGVRRVGGE